MLYQVCGRVSEWFKEPVLKTGDAATHHGFESHSLRQTKAPLLPKRTGEASYIGQVFRCRPVRQAKRGDT